MESGAIPNSDIFTSSGVGSGRFNVEAWEPVAEDTNPYMAVSFPSSATITKLTLQGSGSGKFFSQLSLEYSLQGDDFGPVSKQYIKVPV